MTVLEINLATGWRGGERQTFYNMLGLRDAGVIVHLACLRGSTLETNALKAGFAVTPCTSLLAAVFYLVRIGKQFDFIHAQNSQILTYCLLTKIFHRTKIIFTRRVNFPQRGFLTKLKYMLTDRIVAISQAVKDTLRVFTGRQDIEVISDIVVHENGPNPDRARTEIAHLNINGQHIIGTVAALSSEKDPMTLLKGIQKLAEKRSDFCFLHFGAGELEDDVIQKIEELHLQHRYFLMGFAQNVEDFYSLFEVFVMTSTQEGLGSSVLDAFVRKVPVVSTNAGGLKDLLANERGIACEVGDSDEIARGIETLLEDKAKKEKYVNNAFDYVCKNHSMQHISEQYVALMSAMNISTK
ncbi:MAG TPA: glycosyltransferase family 4 protein [Cyclobacteriaceae bacterium]|jgi:glycosyltransferase involved in cell wall biosynthesis|nr:glycosyltransferase family 4 protein [Cyclobacteriaceae bacterium]